MCGVEKRRSPEEGPSEGAKMTKEGYVLARLGEGDGSDSKNSDTSSNESDEDKGAGSHLSGGGGGTWIMRNPMMTMMIVRESRGNGEVGATYFVSVCLHRMQVFV